MTGRYAEATDVAPDRSRAEIERTLLRGILRTVSTLLTGKE